MQKLVLIPKVGKPIGEPTSYLLNTIGEVLERIIYNRQYPLIDSGGYLSNRQFGFREARSVVDATRLDFELARKTYDKGKYCAQMTLDIALNSASGNHIIEALIAAQTQKYILNRIFDYFQWKPLYYLNEGSKTYVITADVRQESVLGHLLWNLMYNGVLRLPVAKQTVVVGFADKVGVVITSNHPDEVQIYANETIQRSNLGLKTTGWSLPNTRRSWWSLQSGGNRKLLKFASGHMLLALSKENALFQASSVGIPVCIPLLDTIGSWRLLAFYRDDCLFQLFYREKEEA